MKPMTQDLINRHPVTQVGNLLYRRLAVGKASGRCESCELPIHDRADRQSALL